MKKIASQTRTFEINFECRDTIVLRNRRETVVYICGECGGRMIVPEVAAHLTGISVRRIFSGIEDGIFHFIDDPLRLEVCLASVENTLAINGLSAKTEGERE